jgi:hypothetical protein
MSDTAVPSSFRTAFKPANATATSKSAATAASVLNRTILKDAILRMGVHEDQGMTESKETLRKKMLKKKIEFFLNGCPHIF